MLAHSLQTNFHRKIMHNFAWVYLGQLVQGHYLLNVGPWLTDIFYEENNLNNISLTRFVQSQETKKKLKARCFLSSSRGRRNTWNFKVLIQEKGYNWGISYQINKEVCFDINQFIRTSYLFNIGLRHAHALLFSSDRNKTKILRLWLNIIEKISFHIRAESYLK